MHKFNKLYKSVISEQELMERPVERQIERVKPSVTTKPESEIGTQQIVVNRMDLSGYKAIVMSNGIIIEKDFQEKFLTINEFNEVLNLFKAAIKEIASCFEMIIDEDITGNSLYQIDFLRKTLQCGMRKKNIKIKESEIVPTLKSMNISIEFDR